jgi:hypothetical protein
MFIRFVVGRDGEDHRWLTGIITEARVLRDDGVLEPYEVNLLEETYRWLDDHLPCPPFRRSRWPKQAVCWFKDDAGDCIGRMWDLVFLLHQHGRAVRVLKSRRPGRVLYEDAYQVMVEEWRNL